MLRIYFKGTKAQLRAFNWWCQAHPNMLLVDMKRLEVC